jgi:hypothetical protein
VIAITPENLDSTSTQESVERVSDAIGASVNDVLKTVKQLGLSYEPSLLSLTKDSFLFTRDIPWIRERLGLLSATEIELREMQKIQANRSMRNMRILAGAILLVTGFVVVLFWRPFFGYLAGTYYVRRWGGTFPDLVSALMSGFWSFVSKPNVFISLVILGSAFWALNVWWKKQFWARQSRN